LERSRSKFYPPGTYYGDVRNRHRYHNAAFVPQPVCTPYHFDTTIELDDPQNYAGFVTRDARAVWGWDADGVNGRCDEQEEGWRLV
jgi:hypothetical protein